MKKYNLKEFIDESLGLPPLVCPHRLLGMTEHLTVYIGMTGVAYAHEVAMVEHQSPHSRLRGDGLHRDPVMHLPGQRALAIRLADLAQGLLT